MRNRTNWWVATAVALVVATAAAHRLPAAESAMPNGPDPAAVPTPAPTPDMAVPTPAMAAPAPAPARAPAPAIPPDPVFGPTAGSAPVPGSPCGCGAGPAATVTMGEALRCCPSPGCAPTCCALPEFPPATIYGRVRGMALLRDTYHENVSFASLGTTPAGEDPNIVLKDNDVQFPFTGGGEVLVGWMFVPSYFLEFSYFEMKTWDRSAAVRNADGDLFSPFGAFGGSSGSFAINQFDYNDLASVQYRSRFSNMELNLRHLLPMPTLGLRPSFIFGGRSMQIDDDLAYLTESSIQSTTNSILTQTRNRLLGLQIGGLFEFHVDPGWWVNFGMKGAICQNQIDLYSTYNDQNGLVSAQVRREGQTSFVGDLELSFVYECRHWTTEVGYRALWVTGLALGTENLQTSQPLLEQGPLALDDKGQVVYHGPYAGLTFRW